MGPHATTPDPAGLEADTRLVREADDRWVAEVSPRWTVLGGPPNGGYVTALVLRAVAEALPDHPDPATVTTHYLRPARVGPAEVRVEVLHAGRRFARVRGSLWQDGEQCVEVLAATTDLSRLDGPTTVVARPPALPDRADCVVPDDGDVEVPPVRARLDVRVAPDADGWPLGDASGRGEFAAWVQWVGGEPVTPAGLAVLCDAFPPAVFDLGTTLGWVPTIELTVQVRARPVPGWLRVVLRTRALTDGLLEEDGEVWDADDRLVALSRQLALASRP